MEDLGLYIVLIIIGAIVLFVWNNSQNKNSANQLGIVLHEKAIHLDGVGDLEQGVTVNLFCYKDKIGFDTNKYGEENPITQKELAETNIFSKKYVAKSGLSPEEILKNEMPHISQDSYQLPYERIKKVELKSISKMTEKQKSVFWRGIAGGALAGGVGVVLGGMTGLKNDKEQKDFLVLSIIYNNKEGIENTALFATEHLKYHSFRKLPLFLTEKIGQLEPFEQTGAQEL